MIGALVAGITGSGGASLSSYESIATANGTGSSTTITFSSIPSTFKHLQIRFNANSGAGTNINLRINSDSGANYTYHQLSGDGTSATASGGTSRTSIFVGYMTASYYGASVVDILDYTSTTINKTVRSLGGSDANGSGSILIRSGLWINTNAVSTIEIISASGNFTTASTFALYGIKEA
jgi:hypothetical protein